jgi:type I restriction-modification system DNA methylase subunit
MNAVEIEAAVSDLVASPFEPQEFPYAFLAAFGNKETTLAKLKKGNANATDVPGAVLQRNNIHLAVAAQGQVATKLNELKTSLKTAQAKAKFVLATDGVELEAEDLNSGETLACDYNGLAEHFGYFLPLAGISTVKEINENPIDIRATARLNKLYLEILKENPDWTTEEKRPELNQFLARIIFCFFAEDTGIFVTGFTETLQKMSEPDGSNLSFVLSEIFRAMDLSEQDKKQAQLPEWAKKFPYVHGNLFGTVVPTPKFSKIARSYLLRAGELNWRQINPDIFGSMIQAVAEDEERGSLGMHYTSVPNILKVLNPLFLDELREQLEKAGDQKASLLKLRERISRIRVFDPACGAGNFLVIAYKEMRAIEGEINRRRNEIDRATEIHLTNFRGIEIRDFAAEVARLALIIAEFQCDVLYRGPKLALAEFLPLNAENWIVCGNALRLDWTKVCPPTGTGVNIVSTSNDLFETPLTQPRIDFSNEGGETYICGNPPYLGGKKQDEQQKQEMSLVANGRFNAKNLDYICGFFAKAAESIQNYRKVAFVTTSSLNQGIHVPVFWPFIKACGADIEFCYEPFKWANNATNNAGVFCSIIGLCPKSLVQTRMIYFVGGRRSVGRINSYLVDGPNVIVTGRSSPHSTLSKMSTGNQAADGGHLFVSVDERAKLVSDHPEVEQMLRPALGTAEFFESRSRWCLWLSDEQLSNAVAIDSIRKRIDSVREFREAAGDVARSLIDTPHKFRYRNLAKNVGLIIPQVSSEAREYIPCGYIDSRVIVTHTAHAIFEANWIDFAVFNSRIHFVWARTLSGRLGNGLRYSSNLSWNTFPLPTLTEQNKADLTRGAEEILLARERHFPKTIADLYDPENMPDDLRRAHELNDETLERIYIGRRFKNDTERLEKLFEMYGKMTAKDSKAKGKKV